jgi:hypothetical protein
MVKKHSQRFVQENQRGGFTPVPKVSSQWSKQKML